MSPAMVELTEQPLGQGQGWHVSLPWHQPCQEARRSRWPQLPMEGLAAEQMGAEQTHGSPNPSGLRKGKITNIFHFELQLNLEGL